MRKGQKTSEETKRKIGLANSGKRPSEEVKRKRSENLKYKYTNGLIIHPMKGKNIPKNQKKRCQRVQWEELLMMK